MNDDSKFAPPIIVSGIKDGKIFQGQAGIPGPDIAVIVAVWGPLHNDKTHTYHVRGVTVFRTSITETSNGRMYRYCMFPDGRVMLVNEGNISSRRSK